MRLLAILALSVLAACGTGDEDKSSPATCSIVGNNNAVNCNNDGDSSIQQDNSESDEESEVALLWKPESESDGKLVILTTPLEASVEVTGATLSESLENTGPSNGFGTTARGSLPGCDYGKNILVEVFKGTEKLLSVVIPDGCNRFER